MKPLFWDNLETIKKLEKELHEGAVVLAAGDTVLGLLADVSEGGYAQLDALKKRSKKPYLLLVKSKEKVLKLIEKDPVNFFQIEKLMDLCWPGPVTLILKAKSKVPFGVKSPEGNVAIRVPDHAGLQQLLAHFDALYSTSANTSGNPVPADLLDVEKAILDGVSCVVLNEEGTGSIVASTIIDCTGEKIKIVREGAFSRSQLADFL